MATSKIQVTEGSGKNLATNSISEDAVTKEISRVALNNSSGTEIGDATTPVQVSVANTGANGTPIVVDLGANNDVTVTSGSITETNSTAILADTANMDTNLGTIAGAVAAEAASLGNGILIQGDDGTDRKNINVDATTGDVQVDVTNTVTVDGSGVTQPISGTVTANLSTTDNTVLDNIDTNTDYGATTGGGTESGALRVTIANNSTGVLSVDDNGGALTVDNAGTFAVQNTVTSSTTDANGHSMYLNSALSSTKAEVDANGGLLKGYYIYNPNAEVSYVQFFNLASASVTVGTTTPNLSLPIPATAAANLAIPEPGINFGTGMVIAATTLVTGSSAPTSSLVVNLIYK